MNPAGNVEFWNQPIGSGRGPLFPLWVINLKMENVNSFTTFIIRQLYCSSKKWQNWAMNFLCLPLMNAHQVLGLCRTKVLLKWERWQSFEDGWYFPSICAIRCIAECRCNLQVRFAQGFIGTLMDSTDGFSLYNWWCTPEGIYMELCSIGAGFWVSKGDPKNVLDHIPVCLLKHFLDSHLYKWWEHELV